MAILATVALLGVGVSAASMLRSAWIELRAFHPEAFRAAAAAGDNGALADEAGAAIRHRSLHGRSRAEVRALLGRPDRIAHRLHAYTWDVGQTSRLSTLPRGSRLLVEFDPGWHRVVDVRLEAASD